MSYSRIRIDEAAVRAAVREGARIVAEFRTVSSVGEVADCSFDQLYETTATLDPAEVADYEAAVVREVLHRAGLDGGASDATDLSHDTVARIAARRAR